MIYVIQDFFFFVDVFFFFSSRRRPIIELCRIPIIVTLIDEKYVKPIKKLIFDYQELQKKLLSKILLNLKITDNNIFDYIFDYIGYLELKTEIRFGL